MEISLASNIWFTVLIWDVAADPKFGVEYLLGKWGNASTLIWGYTVLILDVVADSICEVEHLLRKVEK